MNFDTEVGKTIVLVVSQFTPNGGVAKINFEPTFVTVDQLLTKAIYASKSEEEHGADRIRDEHDMLAYVYYGRPTRFDDHRRNSTCEYSSMHIYHLSGDQHPELVVGDAWDCEIVKCYARTVSTPRANGPDNIAWTEPKTKDGRTKIHFTVRPVKRIVIEARDVDWEKKGVVVTRTCGKNTSREAIAFDKFVEGAFRYTDAYAGNWVIFGAVGYSNGKVVASQIGSELRRKNEIPSWHRHLLHTPPWHHIMTCLQTSNQWMNNENQKYGGGIKTNRLKAFWRELPEAPPELWDIVVKERLCDRVLAR